MGRWEESANSKLLNDIDTACYALTNSIDLGAENGYTDTGLNFPDMTPPVDPWFEPVLCG